MGINQDALMSVKAQLCEQIDRIASELSHMSPASVVKQIDDIRRIARDYGMTPVAELAHNLESAMARSEGAVTVLPYLDAMRDATGSDNVDPHTTSAWLASVNRRLHG
jgi:hypothetical protein